MDEAEKEGTKPESAPATQAQKKDPAPESRLNRFVVRLLRWILGILIVAGLGAILAILALYMPLRQRLAQSQSEVDRAEQRIAELEGDIEGLSPLDAENQELKAELEKAGLHVAILSARADVAAAQLALAQNDSPKARLALGNTGNTLKAVEAGLKPGEQKLATDMQSRLDLALKGIGVNAYAAASDLDVLATGLIELENAYFTGP